MSDQLKAFGKCLIWGIFALSATAKAPKPSLIASKVTESATTKTLETANWSYAKEGKTLDLVGVIHIADAEYYQTLNRRFTEYDAVFFELVADPYTVKILQEKGNLHGEASSENEYSGLNKMYSLYQTLMDLSLQSKEIDYSAKNFVHADMGPAEFSSLQEEHGENLLEVALSGAAGLDLSKIDQGIMMRAMMTGESSLLKLELVDLLAGAASALNAGEKETITIHARNQKCLDVMEEYLARNPSAQKTAIFYGAGHLPAFHESLVKEGWIRTSSDWLSAWKIDLPEAVKESQEQ